MANKTLPFANFLTPQIILPHSSFYKLWCFLKKSFPGLKTTL